MVAYSADKFFRIRNFPKPYRPVLQFFLDPLFKPIAILAGLLFLPSLLTLSRLLSPLMFQIWVSPRLEEFSPAMALTKLSFLSTRRAFCPILFVAPSLPASHQLCLWMLMSLFNFMLNLPASLRSYRFQTSSLFVRLLDPLFLCPNQTAIFCQPVFSRTSTKTHGSICSLEWVLAICGLF